MLATYSGFQSSSGIFATSTRHVPVLSRSGICTASASQAAYSGPRLAAGESRGTKPHAASTSYCRRKATASARRSAARSATGRNVGAAAARFWARAQRDALLDDARRRCRRCCVQPPLLPPLLLLSLRFDLSLLAGALHRKQLRRICSSIRPCSTGCTGYQMSSRSPICSALGPEKLTTIAFSIIML
jgi:hypothetical protein